MRDCQAYTIDCLLTAIAVLIKNIIDCDIVFKFKEDYSNTPELIDAIKSFIK